MDNTNALYEKGQSRLYLLRRSSFDSVVASAIFYGVVSWGSSSAADRKRLNRLVEKVSSVLVCPMMENMFSMCNTVNLTFSLSNYFSFYCFFTYFFFLRVLLLMHYPLCCCNTANFPAVALNKDYLILSYPALFKQQRINQFPKNSSLI